MFLDHTQRRTTVGRTPLDELIARPEESYRGASLCVIYKHQEYALHIYMTLEA
jgi:hypothetical protein